MTVDFERAQRDLRVILNEWDPIGVADFAPDDEYDCLIVPLLSKLSAGAGKTVIGEFLRHEVEGHFGLDPCSGDTDSVADRLIVWWAAVVQTGEKAAMKKRAYEVARELDVPLRDVRRVMADLGLYLSAATPLTEEQTRSIVSKLRGQKHPGDEDPSGANGRRQSPDQPEA